MHPEERYRPRKTRPRQRAPDGFPRYQPDRHLHVRLVQADTETGRGIHGAAIWSFPRSERAELAPAAWIASHPVRPRDGLRSRELPERPSISVGRRV